MHDNRKDEHRRSDSGDELVHGEEEVANPAVDEGQLAQEEWQRLKDEADIEAYIERLAEEPDPEPDYWLDDSPDFEPDDWPPDEELLEPDPDDWLPDEEPDPDPDDWR
jgi:hypothetical protein